MFEFENAIKQHYVLENVCIYIVTITIYFIYIVHLKTTNLIKVRREVVRVNFYFVF